MLPFYQDEPRAWRRFMLQFSALAAVLALVLAWRGVLPVARLPWIAAVLAALAIAAMLRPRWFRDPHRLAMRVSAWLGERVGRVVLTGLFLLVFMPLGLILRLLGHDPLALRRRPGASSYWRPARAPGRLDRLH